jgi:PleD family two-component response regulator
VSEGSLLLFHIDIDQFKNVNDLRSHALGDRVLRGIDIALYEAKESGRNRTLLEQLGETRCFTETMKTRAFRAAHA